MTCRDCNSEIEPRKILFGKAGVIEMSMCECEAMRLTLKYENTGNQTTDSETQELS